MYLAIILIILTGGYILNLIVEILNIGSIKVDLPEEFKDCYSTDKYAKSQNYLKENTYFKIIHNSFTAALVLFLILSGGFNFIDQICRGLGLGVILTGLLFMGILFLILQIIDIPFKVYQTFVIEEKYGFNRTSPKTFILDTLKNLALTIILGSAVFSAIIWFFMRTGDLAWIFCWLGVTLFELFIIFIAPVTIMPLFNKFTPLQEDQLKEKIQNYAAAQNFKIKGIFKMDGLRRSTKSNAFFTGFGRFRRIVLFDTLIEKHTSDELLSVLAHEMGHFKKKHIAKQLFISIVNSGLMFFILSWFINNRQLFSAFKMQETSIYASLLFFSFIYSPVNLIISIGQTFLSRKYEYEADSYAVSTYKEPQAFVWALKKLAVNNLSNLNPHPLKVFLDYTHPPVLNRIEAIKKAS